MNGQAVYIDYEGNFYDSMYGHIIISYPNAYLVRFDFNHTDSEEVTFYKHQVILTN